MKDQMAVSRCMVLHHLSTRTRRLQAINELVRVLKPSGKLFIQVWAFEQPKDSKRQFTKQDEFVHGKIIKSLTTLSNNVIITFLKRESYKNSSIQVPSPKTVLQMYLMTMAIGHA